METREMKKESGPALSVIIAAYNMREELPKCLDSIAAQGPVDMEVIAVDDGSADDTWPFLQEYAKNAPWLRPVRMEKNGGVSRARNKGLEQARGRYIHFVDADDIVPKGAYKKAVKAALQNNTDIVAGNYRFRSSVQEYSVCYKNDTGLGRCLENNNLSLCNKLFRRQFLLDNGLCLREGMRMAEDALFVCQALRCEPSICCVDACIYVYLFNDLDDERHKHRDFSMESLDNSITVLRTFSQPFPEYAKEQYAQAFVNYLGFIYNNIWRKLWMPDERREGFEKIQKCLGQLLTENPDCELMRPELSERFCEIFGCEYVLFQALSYEKYMLLLAMRTHNVGLAAMPNDISVQFLHACRIGQVGMRTLIRAFLAWLSHKVGKKDDRRTGGRQNMSAGNT